ncbi:MAG: epimerase [Fibrobacteres bacterium]|nr:epimerase [Fibrobacterota bacterium]
MFTINITDAASLIKGGRTGKKATMKIVIPGGTGQVGKILVPALLAKGHEVVVLSRGSQAAPTGAAGKGSARNLPWDGRTLGEWANEMDGADAVINLAGRSVNCRHTEANKRLMMDSRVDSTRVVGEAIRLAASPPKVWLQMSTAAIYAHRFDAPHDEATGRFGGDEPDVPRSWDFSVAIGKAWEKAQRDADTPKTRKVAMRSAIVLNPGRGGIFNILLTLTRLGLGGTIADGRQIISWIHGDDFIRAVFFLLEREDIEGPVNITAPNPLPQKQFMAALRAAWGMPIGLPATRWMMAAAAFVIRTESELTLKSRYAMPARLMREGFRFEYPEWPAAVREIIGRQRRPPA